MWGALWRGLLLRRRRLGLSFWLLLWFFLRFFVSSESLRTSLDTSWLLLLLEDDFMLLLLRLAWPAAVWPSIGWLLLLLLDMVNENRHACGYFCCRWHVLSITSVILSISLYWWGPGLIACTHTSHFLRSVRVGLATLYGSIPSIDSFLWTTWLVLPNLKIQSGIPSTILSTQSNIRFTVRDSFYYSFYLWACSACALMLRGIKRKQRQVEELKQSLVHQFFKFIDLTYILSSRLAISLAPLK